MSGLRKTLLSVVVLSITLTGLFYWATTRYSFTWFEPKRPFWLALGRGSGLRGLDTVKVDEDGLVTLHRMGEGDGWETATLKLSENSLVKLRRSVESNQLLGLQRMYDDENVACGTQWVLLIKQVGNQKSVYFNNNFPVEIRQFASDLDAILAENGIDNVRWRRVVGDAGQHARELWESIR